MACPFRRTVVSLVGLFLFAHGALAEAATPEAADPVVQMERAPPAKSEQRKTSPRVASLLAAATPKFEAEKKPEESAAQQPRATAEFEAPANGIVRLPDYIVRDRRPPKREEVMSPRELASVAMRRYLGDEDGLDRGFLNLFTVPSVWKRIPVLGRFKLEGFATNEERAVEIYRAEKKAEEFASLRSLLSPARRPTETPASGPAPSDTSP